MVTFTITEGGVESDPIVIPIAANVGGPAARQAAKLATIVAFLRPSYPGLTVVGNRISHDYVSFRSVKDTTAEAIKMAYLPGPPRCDGCEFAVVFSFQGGLNSRGWDGSESVFEASFGDGSTTFASASVSYSDLLAPTIDALLSEMYDDMLGDLPTALRGRLHLDLTKGWISFMYAHDALDPFVGSNTTSEATMQLLELRILPEPPALALTGLALVVAAALRKRRGTLASSLRIRR